MTNSERHQRLCNVQLDERTLVRRKPEVEHERAIAIYDLLEENYFCPVGDYVGPYSLHISLVENRLVLDIRSEDDITPRTEVVLPVTPFRAMVKDYFLICESYYTAIKKSTPSQIEAIDMGRRGLHNEGSEIAARASGRQDRSRSGDRPASLHPGLHPAYSGLGMGDRTTLGRSVRLHHERHPLAHGRSADAAFSRQANLGGIGGRP